MESNRPFCIALGNQEFIVVIFNDELAELRDCAMDAGNALWYVMGTDAWLELQTTGFKPSLVGRSYDKTYFTCIVSDEIFEKIMPFEEIGIVVISSSEELKPEELMEAFDEDSSLDDIAYWIEDKSENHGVDIIGLIFCYYSTAARKKYHGG